MKINTYNTKLRAMGGHVVLAVLFGFFITGIQPQPDEKEAAEKFFKTEEFYLQLVEGMVLRKVRNERYKGWPRSQEEADALVYVTFLSFWIAIDFEICKIYYSSFNYDELSNSYYNMCHSYYEDTAAAFEEFRYLIKSSRDNRAYHYEDDQSFEIAVNEIERLSLDFLTDDKQSTNEDHNSIIIRWRKIKRELEVSSIFHPGSSIIERLQNQEHGENRYNFIHGQIKTYINREMSLILYKIFFNKMTGEYSEIYRKLLSLPNVSQFSRQEIILDTLMKNFNNQETSDIQVKRGLNVIRIMRSIDQERILENLDETHDSESPSILSYLLGHY